MKIKEIMTGMVVTVELDDTLAVIKDIFDNVDFHHVLVVSSGTLHGVVSDRDLLRELSPNVGTIAETRKDLSALNKKAHQIMTRKPITLTTEASIDDVITLFKENKISCIPVVNEDNKPIGIVSWRDLLKLI